MLPGNFLLMAGGFEWVWCLLQPCFTTQRQHGITQLCDVPAVTFFDRAVCSNTGLLQRPDPNSSCRQYRDRSRSLGGLKGEKRRVSGERKGQSVLHVAVTDLVEFMVIQYFIKIKSRGLWLPYGMRALSWSSRVKSWKHPLFFQFVLPFLVTWIVWSVMHRHNTGYLQLVDILLIQHRKGKDDLVIGLEIIILPDLDASAIDSGYGCGQVAQWLVCQVPYQ